MYDVREMLILTKRWINLKHETLHFYFYSAIIHLKNAKLNFGHTLKVD